MQYEVCTYSGVVGARGSTSGGTSPHGPTTKIREWYRESTIYCNNQMDVEITYIKHSEREREGATVAIKKDIPHIKKYIDRHEMDLG